MPKFCKISSSNCQCYRMCSSPSKAAFLSHRVNSGRAAEASISARCAVNSAVRQNDGEWARRGRQLTTLKPSRLCIRVSSARRTPFRSSSRKRCSNTRSHMQLEQDRPWYACLFRAAPGHICPKLAGLNSWPVMLSAPRQLLYKLLPDDGRHGACQSLSTVRPCQMLGAAEIVYMPSTCAPVSFSAMQAGTTAGVGAQRAW